MDPTPKPRRFHHSLDDLLARLRPEPEAVEGEAEGSPENLRQSKVFRLEEEVAQAQRESDLQLRALEDSALGRTTTIHDPAILARQGDELRAIGERLVREVERRHALEFLLDSVTAEAHDALRSDTLLLDRFLPGAAQRGYVLSLDLRGSTALMLKARSQAGFATFITAVVARVEQCVKRHLGVFNKFTGDGVLAFFPEFFTGPDAGLRVLACAREAMAVFPPAYEKHASTFFSLTADELVGFGAGIDFGDFHMRRFCGALDILGAPVVYACRMSAAPPGRIYLNHSAMRAIRSRHAKHITAAKINLPVKGEPPVTAYDAALKPSAPQPSEHARPEWMRH